MSAQLIAIGLTLLVHVVGAVFLIWAMIGPDDDVRRLRDWWPRDDDGSEPPRPPEPDAGPGGLPLPTAGPSPMRLREPGRLADGHPAPPRRPEHPRRPAREPAESGPAQR
jgi:hypothetical protein